MRSVALCLHLALVVGLLGGTAAVLSSDDTTNRIEDLLMTSNATDG